MARSVTRFAPVATAAVAAVVLTTSFVYLEAPWFSLGTGLLLICAAILSLPRFRRAIGFRRSWHAWIALGIGVALFVLQSFWVELNRQQSQRLEVTGVQFTTPQRGIFDVGVGDSLDVRLSPQGDSASAWRLRIQITDTTFNTVAAAGIEQVSQKRKRTEWQRLLDRLDAYDRGWVSLWGTSLTREAPDASVRNLRVGSAPIRVRLVILRDGRPGLQWGTGAVAALSLPDSTDPLRVLAARFARQIRSGVRLDELAWNELPDTALARRIVITLRYAPRQTFALLQRLRVAPSPVYQIAARDDSVEVRSVGDSATLPVITRGDTVRVYAGGSRWAFILDRRVRDEHHVPDVLVRFVRGPSPILGWLPPRAICPVASECTLVSNRRLPPSTPHFDLSEFGVDTGRFSLFARVSAEGKKVTFVTPEGRSEFSAGAAMVIPTVARFRQEFAAYEFRLLRLQNADVRAMGFILLALAVTIAGCAQALRSSPEVIEAIESDALTAQTAWALINLATVLLGVRLVLGLRDTYAPPYHERGADTAVGLWLTLALLVPALLGWQGWAPALIGWIHRIERRLAWYLRSRLRRVARLGSEETLRPEHASLLPTRLVPNRIAVRGLLVAAIGLVALFVLRRVAVLNALAVSGFTLGLWLALEYLNSARSEPARSLAEVIRPPKGDPDLGRRAAVAMLALGLPVTVLFRSQTLFVAAGAVVLFLAWYGVLSLVHFVRPGARLASSGRWTAALVVLLGLAAFNFLLIRVDFDGPTLLYFALCLSFFLLVRTGALLGETLSTLSAGGSSLSVKMRAAILGAGAMLLFSASAAITAKADFGLMLVAGVPLIITLLIAVGLERFGRAGLAGLAAVMMLSVYVAKAALIPSLSLKEFTPSAATSAFNSAGGALRRVSESPLPSWFAAALEGAVTRSAVRGLAAFQPYELERVLPLLPPSEARESIIPALEQVWGGRAYAAAGWTGSGLAGPIVVGRGISPAVADAENTFAVFILAEHGLIGGAAILACFAAIGLALLPLIWRQLSPQDGDPVLPTETLGIVTGGVLLLTMPAAYVAAANVALLPLTGQNIPFLGLNAWSDVVLVGMLLSAIVTILFTAGRRR